MANPQIIITIPKVFTARLNVFMANVQKFQVQAQAQAQTHSLSQFQKHIQQTQIVLSSVATKIKHITQLFSRLAQSLQRAVDKILSVMGNLGKLFMRGLEGALGAIGAALGPVGWILTGAVFTVSSVIKLSLAGAGFMKWLWDKMVGLGDSMLQDFLLSSGAYSSIAGVRAFRTTFAGLPQTPAMMSNIAKGRGDVASKQSIALRILGVENVKNTSDMMVQATLAAAKFMKKHPKEISLRIAEEAGLTTLFSPEYLIALHTLTEEELIQKAKLYEKRKELFQISDLAVEGWKTFTFQVRWSWARVKVIIADKLASAGFVKVWEDFSKAVVRFINIFLNMPLSEKLINSVTHLIKKLSDWLKFGSSPTIVTIIEETKKEMKKLISAIGEAKDAVSDLGKAMGYRTQAAFTGDPLNPAGIPGQRGTPSGPAQQRPSRVEHVIPPSPRVPGVTPPSRVTPAPRTTPRTTTPPSTVPGATPPTTTTPAPQPIPTPPLQPVPSWPAPAPAPTPTPAPAPAPAPALAPAPAPAPRTRFPQPRPSNVPVNVPPPQRQPIPQIGTSRPWHRNGPPPAPAPSNVPLAPRTRQPQFTGTPVNRDITSQPLGPVVPPGPRTRAPAFTGAPVNRNITSQPLGPTVSPGPRTRAPAFTGAPVNRNITSQPLGPTVSPGPRTRAPAFTGAPVNRNITSQPLGPTVSPGPRTRAPAFTGVPVNRDISRSQMPSIDPVTGYPVDRNITSQPLGPTVSTTPRTRAPAFTGAPVNRDITSGPMPSIDPLTGVPVDRDITSRPLGPTVSPGPRTRAPGFTGAPVNRDIFQAPLGEIPGPSGRPKDTPFSGDPFNPAGVLGQRGTPSGREIFRQAPFSGDPYNPAGVSGVPGGPSGAPQAPVPTSAPSTSATPTGSHWLQTTQPVPQAPIPPITLRQPSGPSHWDNYMASLGYLETTYTGKATGGEKGIFQRNNTNIAEAKKYGIEHLTDGTYEQQRDANIADIKRKWPEAATEIENGNYRRADEILRGHWPSLPGGAQHDRQLQSRKDDVKEIREGRGPRPPGEAPNKDTGPSTTAPWDTSRPWERTGAAGAAGAAGISPEARKAPSGQDPNAFIVHHTGPASSVQGVVNSWRTERPGIGSQYIMDREGVIHDVQKEFGYPGTSHAKDIREPYSSQGIENRNIVGMEILASNEGDINLKQIESFRNFIREKYPNTQILSHGEISTNKQPVEGALLTAIVRSERAGKTVSNESLQQLLSDLRTAEKKGENPSVSWNKFYQREEIDPTKFQRSTGQAPGQGPLSNKGMTIAEADAYTKRLNAMTPEEREAEFKRRDAGTPAAPAATTPWPDPKDVKPGQPPGIPTGQDTTFTSDKPGVWSGAVPNAVLGRDASKWPNSSAASSPSNVPISTPVVPQQQGADWPRKIDRTPTHPPGLPGWVNPDLKISPGQFPGQAPSISDTPRGWSDLPERPGHNYAETVKNVDPRLREILSAAKTQFETLHPGYKIQGSSAFREGAGFHGKNKAIDMIIVDPNGNEIPNKGILGPKGEPLGDDTGLYHQFARIAKGEQHARYPELDQKFSWGGSHGTLRPSGGPPDWMHFDFGDERGHWTQNQMSNMGELPGLKYGGKQEPPWTAPKKEDLSKLSYDEWTKKYNKPMEGIYYQDNARQAQDPLHYKLNNHSDHDVKVEDNKGRPPDSTHGDKEENESDATGGGKIESPA